MTRRGGQEGSVYRRKSDGRWVGVLHVGYAGDVRKRRVFYGRTRAEVVKRLGAAQRTHDDGLPIPSERLTVGAFLDQWLTAVGPSLRPNTLRRYAAYVHLHATPLIGRTPLAKLTPEQLQRLYAERLDAKLSPTTVHHLHGVLHRALGQAARWGMVVRNVADLVDPPRMARKEMRTLSPAQAATLIVASGSERLGAIYVLAITTGARQGEMLALRWRDVDLDRGTMRITASLQWTKTGAVLGEPKTARSRRQVMLPKIAIESLRAHRASQVSERLRMGPAWQDLDLLFPNEVGGPMSASNLIRRSFKRLLTTAGLPPVRFHDLRHSAATLLLAQGVHPKIVSEMLGHSSIAITLDLYSHVTPTMQREAVAAMDNVLSRAT